MLEFDATWIDQQQRIDAAYAARSEEANLNTDLCTEGRFDGIIGSYPRFPEIHAYWQGYVSGLRNFWLSEQQKTIEGEMVAFKTTTKPQALTYSFDKKNFPSLLMCEFEAGEWHDVGFDALDPDEQLGLVGLCTEAGLTELPDYDPNKLLLIKAADGVMAELYGPALFRDGEEIVLKVGANQCRVTQTGDRITVSNLSGKLSIQAKAKLIGTEYPVATVSLMSSKKEIYRIRVSLDPNQDLSVADLEVVTIGNEANSLLPYLSPVPSPEVKTLEAKVQTIMPQSQTSEDEEDFNNPNLDQIGF